MARGPLSKMADNTIYLLFVSFLVIIFWHATWELVTEFISYIEQKYNIKKWKIYVTLLVGVILLIEYHPTFLEKI
jgi:TRAP-type C4-dicarboxylate transport system permease small subunit